MKPQIYKEERDPIHLLKFHLYARSHKPNPVYLIVHIVTAIISFTLFRLRVYGLEHVPRTGGVVIVSNHGSYMDHFFLGMRLRRRVRFAAKSQMFKGPIGWFYAMGGVFPVSRGRGDEELFVTIKQLLDNGEAVVFYPEGGRSRTGEIGRPKLGIGKLALETGVPIVPAAIYGTYDVRKWKQLIFPAVTVKFGSPLRFTKTSEADRSAQKEAALNIMEQVVKLYAEIESWLQYVRKFRRPTRWFAR